MITNRRHSGLGSQYHPVNNLAVVEASMKQNQVKHFRPIIKQGQWVVKSLGFKLEQKVQIRANVIGQGAGYLYASFGEGSDTELLDIKKVMQGIYQLTFIVPNTSLPNFRIGIASTIPKGYGIKYLSNETQYKIRTSSLMLQQHTPMYESPGIGFAGFGAFVDRSINDTPQGGSDSAGNPYWDGNLDNFDWSTYMFSGVPGHGSLAPKVYGSYTGYYGHRASLMQAKFSETDQFLGWDTMESRGSAGSKPAIQAGVPICMVLQFFTINRKQSDLISLDDARTDKTPHWMFANNMSVPAHSIMFAHENFRYNNVPSKVAMSDTKARPWDTSKSCIADTVMKQPAYYFGDQLSSQEKYATKLEWYDPSSGSWSAPQAFPNHIPTTNSKGFTKVIFRVPRQLNPETDKDIITQLQAAGVDYAYDRTKKIIPTYIKDLNQQSGEPVTFGARSYTPAHVLLGRPNKFDTLYQEDDTGDWFLAPSFKTNLDCFLLYPIHPKAGYTNPQRDSYNGGRGTGVLGRDTNNKGRVRIAAGEIKVSDVEKFARMNFPELYTAFWPYDGFKTGGRVYAIGRGMSTSITATIDVSKAKDPINTPANEENVEDNIGTKASSRIKPKYLINSTEIEDGIMSTGEVQIKKHWKDQFGVELSEEFFRGYKLPSQSTTNPLMYGVTDPGTGLYIEAPYQIMIFEIDEYYDGPAVFYGTETVKTTDPETLITTAVLKSTITKPEGKLTARGKGEPVYLNTRTPFAYTYSQKIDILEEFEEQLGVINNGGSSQDAIGGENPLNNAPEDTTAAINTQALIDEWLRNQQEGRTQYQSTRGNKKYVRLQDVINPNPEFYREGSTSLAGLKGFSNTRDFYVEDVTTKWTANESQGLSGYSGMGNIITDAAGNTVEFAQDSIFSPVREALAENIGDGVSFLKTTGKFAIYSYLAFKLIPLAAKATVTTYDVFNRPTRPTTAARRRARRRSGKRR